MQHAVAISDQTREQAGALREAAPEALRGRIERSILRPLGIAAERAGAGSGRPAAPTAAADAARSLALALTELEGEDVRILEARAAAQAIVLELAGPDHEQALLQELRAIQAGQEPTIRLAPRGPLLVTNVELRSWLGEQLVSTPQVALCRCGGSQAKPFCDGSHAEIGFDDAKDPKRVPDRQDTYVGQQITVLDNRGTCQHSGYCSDRLANVFRAGEEPFIRPSGGRMDEIIRAVRDCPSGALSYVLNGAESSRTTDQQSHRPPVIEVSRDGPYRVQGAVRLLDADGSAVERNEGASVEHYALCRCGHAQNKPFCTGMHWYVGFRDPEPDPERGPTLFEWAGGLPALTRMTRLFYEKYVPEDPLLAPLFAEMSVDHPERVAKWLAEVFGGPPLYSQEFGGYPRMLSQHRGRCLTEEWRERWVTLLIRSSHEAGLPNDPEFRSALQSYIEWGSRLAVENSQTDARPPEQMPMPHWDWTTAAGPPGSRISALATADVEEEPEVELPADGEAVGFAAHVQPLFRRRDRDSMRFAFDLWSFEDVRDRAEEILGRLRDGSMPCDGAWAPERIDVFARWIAGGKEE